MILTKMEARKVSGNIFVYIFILETLCKCSFPDFENVFRFKHKWLFQKKEKMENTIFYHHKIF